MSSIYYKTNGTQLVEIKPIESNGPGNLSTPRQVVDVEFLDKTFTTPTDAFVVGDDVTTRFVQGFAFNIIGGSAYDGAYTVNAGGAALPGDTVALYVNGKTHVPVTNIVDAANPTPYTFRAGFTSAVYSPADPINGIPTYYYAWELAGDVSAIFHANDVIQLKHILFNDTVTNTRVNRTYTVFSVTYNVLGFTTIVTRISREDPASTTPVISVDAQSVVVFPVPAGSAFGYTQYTVPTIASSLNLVGKGSVTYNATTSWGEAVQGNLIHMLEHFSNTTAPASPINGQLWFDTSGTGPALQLYNNAAWYGVVASGMPVQGDINMNNHYITSLANAVNATDAVNLQFADGRYVNVAGDTMTGALILNADPTTSLGAATKQYVDMFTSGIIWLTPVLDPNLFNDSLSAPPVVDAYTMYHKTFIVSGTGTGAWTGFNGHLMAWDGTAWQSVLGRAVAIGDRFGVFAEPDNNDPLSTMPAGGLLNQAGKIATVTGTAPYTYTFYTPAEPDAFSVKGIFGNASAYQSPHMGHSYTFRGVYGSGAYGTGYQWIEFSGPQMIIDGAGVIYDGNTLNVGAGTGITVNADSVQLDLTYADNRYVNTAGDTMTGALTLSADPTLALHAATKQYVDGRALLYFTPGRSVTAPNATIPVHSLTATGAETDIDVALVPKGVGAITGNVADNTAIGGNKRGNYAVDLQVLRTLADEVASGLASTVAGGTDNKASSTCATVAGGGGNYAAATYAFVGGGSLNIASGNRSTIPGGNQNTAGGVYSTIGGGSGHTASADGTTIAGGITCSATALSATVSGGNNNVADGAYSTIPGGYDATTRGNYGRHSYASGMFVALGDSQVSTHVLRAATTAATVTILSSDSTTATAVNTTVVPDNHAYTVVSYITARNTSTGDMASWKIEGAVKRGVGAATTALVGTPTVTAIAADAGAATWAVAMVASTTLGSVVIQVTGVAATNIHWVCKLSTVEVG